MSGVHTCPLLDERLIFVETAAGSDGDVVEASRHQRVENACRGRLGHGEGVNGPLPVTQGHQVSVHLTYSLTPRHAEEVHAPVVADPDIAHCRRH